jgi:hypothetical protein
MLLHEHQTFDLALSQMLNRCVKLISHQHLPTDRFGDRSRQGRSTRTRLWSVMSCVMVEASCRSTPVRWAVAEQRSIVDAP